MKKVISILLITVVLVSALIIYYKASNTNELPETTLVKCFSYSNARIVSSEIYFWGRLDLSYKTADKLKLLAYDFSKELGIINNGSLSDKVIQNDLIQKIELSGVTQDSKIVTINAQVSKKNDTQYENFISVDVSKDLSNSGLDDIRQKTLDIFKKHKIKAKVNSCVTGSFEGQLKDSQLNEICKRMFKETEAKKVEGMRDRNLISVSAYSPIIEDFINVNGKKVNLNLAIRYNAIEGRTYLWLATPVITTEY